MQLVHKAACNVQSRADELEHVALWAKANNLMLNRAKTIEVIFTDSRRKLQPRRPPELPGIRRAVRQFECLVSHPPITCLSVITSVTSSVGAPSPCMH